MNVDIIAVKLETVNFFLYKIGFNPNLTLINKKVNSDDYNTLTMHKKVDDASAPRNLINLSLLNLGLDSSKKTYFS